jgi:hypothetical protein
MQIMQRDYVAEYNRVIPIIIRALDHYSDRLIVLANADEVKWNAGLKNDLLEIVLEIPKVIENIRVLEGYLMMIEKNKKLIVTCLELYVNDMESSVKFVEDRLTIPIAINLQWTNSELDLTKNVLQFLSGKKEMPLLLDL